MNADRVPVYAMPRLRRFLETNGPWSQLVTAGNIVIREWADGRTIRLNERMSVTPFLVPHRDEYSETVGIHVRGPNRSAVFLPDVDKWDRWQTRIEDVLSKVDVAFLDGNIDADGELPGRDMSKAPLIHSSSRACNASQTCPEPSETRCDSCTSTTPTLSSIRKVVRPTVSESPDTIWLWRASDTNYRSSNATNASRRQSDVQSASSLESRMQRP